MDSLELHLKLEKLESSLIPESSVKYKTELYQKMSSEWTEVDGKSKQLIKDASDVSLFVNSSTTASLRQSCIVNEPESTRSVADLLQFNTVSSEIIIANCVHRLVCGRYYTCFITDSVSTTTEDTFWQSVYIHRITELQSKTACTLTSVA